MTEDYFTTPCPVCGHIAEMYYGQIQLCAHQLAEQPPEKTTKVEGRTCHAYFRGSDGKGTCDSRCQWYVEDQSCSMEVPREDWNTKRDPLKPKEGVQ